MSQINRDAELLERLSRAEDRVEKIKEAIARVSTPASPEEIVTMAVKQQADGIAYTYNEPAIFAEYAHDTMVRARKKGLKNIYVSNGFETEETFAYLKEYLDAINIDLKSFREEFYRKICFARLEPVKENIRRFFKSGIVTEVTTLIIPGHNDSTKELQEIAKFLAGISTDLPWHISAYHPAYKLTAPPTPLETLKQAYRIGKKAGLKYVYVGNVADRQHSQTRCPNCQALLIDRFGYQTEVDNLDVTKGKCRKCGEKIYGVFA